MNPFNGRDLLSLQEWSVEDIERVLELAADLKQKFRIGVATDYLKNKTFFMLFYASSTRTRNSFEAALTQLGGHAHYLNPKTMRAGDPGAPEAIADTAKVLSRYGHGIGIRIYFPQYGEGEKVIREYAKHASIPVVSMESDVYHPCQALADLMTIREKFKETKHLKYVQAWGYSPDALRVCAVPNSNILLMPRFGMDVTYVRPPEFTLHPDIIQQATVKAETHGGSFAETDNLEEAIEDADIIYMRQHCTLDYGKHGPEKEQQIVDKYSDWTLTSDLLRLAKKSAVVMHCLPVDRDHEIASDVLDGPQSIVYDEAENRLHVQKAVLSLVM
ncbi:MAG: ornithine carbamoyltransferase [Candidatus Thorarchaeota archaeon]